MKAVVLAGGRGERISKILKGKNKCMLEVRGKTLIEYNLDMAAELDIDEIIIVVSYKAEDIINYIGTEYKGKKVKYAIQWERKGVVDAISCARPFIGNHDFVLLMGDQLLAKPDLKGMINYFKTKQLFSVCGVIKEPNKKKISKTYAIMSNDAGRIFRLIEKPKNPIGDLQGTGFCVFSNKLLDYIEKTPINQIRGEQELVDWIQCAIDDGKPVEIYHVGEKYTNINTEEDYIYAQDILTE